MQHPCAHSPKPLCDLLPPQQCAVLFILFVIITLAWEIGTALLAFATVLLSGRKALWLQRIKAEILALGLITLILSVISVRKHNPPGSDEGGGAWREGTAGSRSAKEPFAPQTSPLLLNFQPVLQGPLEKICMPGEPHDASSVGICPPGEAPVFSYHLIHEAHILLFFAAIVHIVITCGSFYVSLVAVSSMARGMGLGGLRDRGGWHCASLRSLRPPTHCIPLFSLSVCLLQMRHWVQFEKAARKGRYLNVNHDSIVRSGLLGLHGPPPHTLSALQPIALCLVLSPTAASAPCCSPLHLRYLGGNWFTRLFWTVSTSVTTSVNEGLYNLMRILFK